MQDNGQARQYSDSLNIFVLHILLAIESQNVEKFLY